MSYETDCIIRNHVRRELERMEIETSRRLLREWRTAICLGNVGRALEQVGIEVDRLWTINGRGPSLEGQRRASCRCLSEDT